VCKNAAKVIGETIKSFSGLTDDILVYDNGSTDNTKNIVKQSNAKLVEGSWEGFGKTKNNANALAKYDWILSLDADEAIDEELKQNLLQQDLAHEKNVFEFKFKNFLGDKWLRFGEWGDDKHIRLFNRKKIKWNDADVHESLLLPKDVKVISIPGFVLHKTAGNIEEYKNKVNSYAVLNAEKYFKQNKRSGSLKMFFSAVFSFIKNYFFKLGFLDGATGYHCARINARYTFLKYKKLNELNQQSAPDSYRDSSVQSGKTS
ncbi:MAG TPA: glycosyltransferase family 2 protein, partial [Chitinophagaceae bacterium]|nr:glycosyltransferase family 2 protein [Chitinophagaceae bacterium]